MKAIEEIQSELKSLAHELEQLKESCSAEEREIDFERLSIDGSHKPITPHPLSKFDNYAQKCYLTMLLTVARFEEDKLPASLLFAHRIAFGMDYLSKGENLQSEYIAAQTLSYKQLDEIAELFKKTDERLMLILECMLMAGIFDKGKKDAIDYIVQLSQLLELSKNDLVFLSNMAAVILTQDLDAYKCDIRNKYEIFVCYLNNLALKIQIVFECALRKGHFDIEESILVFAELRATKCKCLRSFSLENNIITYNYFFDCLGSKEQTLKQTVGKNFVLLAKADEIMVNRPIGAEAHPLTPIPLIQQAYDDAWEKFRNSSTYKELGGNQ